MQNGQHEKVVKYRWQPRNGYHHSHFLAATCISQLYTSHFAQGRTLSYSLAVFEILEYCKVISCMFNGDLQRKQLDYLIKYTNENHLMTYCLEDTIVLESLQQVAEQLWKEFVLEIILVSIFPSANHRAGTWRMQAP